MRCLPDRWRWPEPLDHQCPYPQPLHHPLGAVESALEMTHSYTQNHAVTSLTVHKCTVSDV